MNYSRNDKIFVLKEWEGTLVWYNKFKFEKILSYLEASDMLIFPPPPQKKMSYDVMLRIRWNAVYHYLKQHSFYFNTDVFLLGTSQCLSWWRICLQFRRPRFDLWVRKIPWRREWLPTPVFLPRKSHGQRSLVGYTVHGVTKSWTQLSN